MEDDGAVLDAVAVQWSYAPRRRAHGSAVPDGQVLVRIEGCMPEAAAELLLDAAQAGRVLVVSQGGASALDDSTAARIGTEVREYIRRK
jgi:hypothetical protein